MKSGLCAILGLVFATSAQAQAIKTEPPLKEFSEEEIAAIAMPDLAFDAAKVKPTDFDKYFYFHRPETSFSIAFADVKECDSVSSGISYYAGVENWQLQNATMQHGELAGGIGALVGGLLADAIFGSGERRRLKRLNIRNCMFYKGYDRYGLAKDNWKEFHFEEGHGRKDEDKREAALLMQARVASGPKPDAEVLAP